MPPPSTSPPDTGQQALSSFPLWGGVWLGWPGLGGVERSALSPSDQRMKS